MTNVNASDTTAFGEMPPGGYTAAAIVLIFIGVIGFQSVCDYFIIHLELDKNQATAPGKSPDEISFQYY